MQTIYVSNTLTKKKEILQPVEPGHIRMYACGVTVYDHCHIGHAMQAIYFDVIRNFLEFVGYKVTYVRNFTDVDDKIIDRARERGMSPLDLSQQMIESSDADMKALGIRRATHEPKVSETIPEIIGMIQDLIRRGFAYEAGGDVYYRVKSKADYGKLSNRKVDELRSGNRDIVRGLKEDELDFALWKKDETPGAHWTSPWGEGRPGWHIECSAMARKYLGKHFDIHGGGLDLVFPHHENEIAQSEAANDCQYANVWIHSGLLTINKQKMSKSLKNHVLISEFLKKFPAEVLRLAYLQNHYSSNTDFSEQVFQRCAERLLYYYETLQTLDELAQGATGQTTYLPGFTPEQVRRDFVRNMADDFNSVNALGDLNLACRKANELATAKKSPARAETALAYVKALREAFKVFGLLEQAPAVFMEQLKDQVLPQKGITRAEIATFIDKRQQARADKNYAESDAIRQQLSQRGIELMDTPTGTQWRIRFGEDA